MTVPTGGCTFRSALRTEDRLECSEPMKLLVIADDITGAAEMAGIALGFGCRVRFTTTPDRLAEVCADVAAPSEGAASAATEASADAAAADGASVPPDVIVCATDTRSMSCGEAVAETERIVARLHEAARTGALDGVRLFKKTDSVLRGHVTAELRALMRAGYDRALLLPANPSKGRCIVGGRYLIDGVPVDRTLFRTDPEFPALTADVVRLLGGGVRYATPDAGQLEAGITIGECPTTEAMAAYAARFGGERLLWAGAADALRALLASAGTEEHPQEPFAGLGTRRTLVVCGSTVRHGLAAEPFFRRRRVATVPMPDAVFAGGAPTDWIGAARAALADGADALLLRIPQRVEVDGARARHLRGAMAQTVAALVTGARFDELVIEGGATAYAILGVLGWRDFVVTDRIAPGVVRLRYPAAGLHLIFKPGSYDWGATFV